MEKWDIALWVAGIILAAALTGLITIQAVNWIAPRDPYGPGRSGTGVLPKSKG